MLTPEEFHRLHEELLRTGADPDITSDPEHGTINWAAIRKAQRENPMHNEVHVCNFDNGHINSVDCWCEPVVINRVINKHGIDCLVVEHEDYTELPRTMVVTNRDALQSFPFGDHPVNFTIDAPWITRLLAPYGAPPLDPHERNL